MNKLTEKILKEIKELKEREPLEAAANYSYRAGYKHALSAVERIIHFCAEDTTEWIPIEESFPENDDYILLSFENFSLPLVGRYGIDSEGGAFYIGDDDEECLSENLFVNAWMPLPDPYKKEM